ncbi:MAG TPA: PQQ-dependent sugar dehydrogenase [Actinomycetota bacterium]|nr:PQQ-dependent sugar dehydrogenase [Actinomycetota bacterium]
MKRLPAVALGLAMLAACSSGPPKAHNTLPPTIAPSPTPTPTVTLAPTPTPTASRASACSVAPQSPPSGTISANFPTALAFAPDGRLFWAERSGTVRVWQNGAAHTFARVSTVTTEPGGGYSERGLLGLAISPTFARDRYVYAFYSSSDRVHQYVIRWTDCAGRGTHPTILISLPAGGDCCHKGGRIAFGPDGFLYVTLGDEHDASTAQHTSDVRGKLLRYTATGHPAPGNPFGNAVYAFGFRNPFGLAISSSGRIAVTSNGPTGEISGVPATGYDIVVDGVVKGGGYEWARCYGYSHPINGQSCGAGQHGPTWSSESSTVVPTGAWYVDGSGPSGYAGRLVFCTYNSGMLILTGDRSVRNGPSGCRLAVTQAPNHVLYYSDTSHIYRLA